MTTANFAYEVALSADGALSVNGASVTLPASRDASVGDDALAWVLEQVAREHMRIGGVMDLSLLDHRPGGYGARHLLLAPGQVLTVDRLREMSGRNMAHWGEEAPVGLQPPTRRGRRVQQKQPSKTAVTPGEDEGGDEARVQPGWEPYTPKPEVAAPALDTEPAPEPKPDVSPRARRRWWPWAAALAVIAAALVWNAQRPHPQVEYIAVCVDQRTDVRVPTADQDACDPEDQVSPHFQWWYVSPGEQVPAVGEATTSGSGSYTFPENDDASVIYGFVDDGGVVGGDEG